MDGVEVRTLTDGGQPAEDTANALAEFIADAEKTLEVAIYDLNLPPELDEIVCGALPPRRTRGVAVRLAYNVDHREGQRRCRHRRSRMPDAVEAMPFPTAAHPGRPRPHAPQVRRARRRRGVDRVDELDGSTRGRARRTSIVTVDSPALAARYLDDFEQLWTTRTVSHSGKVDTAPVATACARGSARAAARSSRTGSRRRSARRSAASA